MSRLKGLAARARSLFGARSSESAHGRGVRLPRRDGDEAARRARRTVAAPRRDAARSCRSAGWTRIARTMRDGRGARWFDDLIADVRYALRAMRRAPGFAIAVALTLGVGIGVNGIVFGSVDALLFRPVPAQRSGAARRAVQRRHEDASSRSRWAYEDYARLPRQERRVRRPRRR